MNLKTKNINIMKTIIKLSTLAVLFFATINVSAKGFNFDDLSNYNNESDFGWYEIKIAENINKISDVPEVYEVVYDMLEKPVTIELRTDSKGKYFIVSGENFELQYTYKDEKFGVQYVDKKFAELPRKEVRKNINKDAFNHQRIIAWGPQRDDYFLALIASYLPEVVQI